MLRTRRLGTFLRATGDSFVAARGFSSSRTLLSQRTLVLAEHNNKSLDEGTLPAVTAASKLGGEITLLVAGKDCQEVASKAAQVKGVSQVLVADHEAFEKGLAENVADLLVKVQEQNKFTHIFAPASTYGKNILPRTAALLDVAAITDVLSVDSADTFKRPIYAGNAIATVKSSDAVKVATVRTTAFEKAAVGDQSVGIKAVSFEGQGKGVSKWIKEELQKSNRPDLASAKIVVSGGRGVKSKENFALIEKLADALNAAVGASRAAVDAGYAPNDWQVGQTGKVVAPQLYIAVAISGQIQHLAGMKDSKVIVAINNAEDAPIFQVSDYGLVADLFVAVPELINLLEKNKAK